MIAIENKNVLCQHYLNRVYQALPFSFETNRSDVVTETYGEILYSGVAKLLKHYPLTPSDVFVDLGSGQGKLALQVFMTSAVGLVKGIELLPTLHSQAELAKTKLKTDFPEMFASQRDVQFVSSDFLKTSFDDATVLFLGSPCFSPQLMLAIGNKANAIKTLRRLFTLRPIPNLRHLHFRRTLRLQASWDAALCYVYEATP